VAAEIPTLWREVGMELGLKPHFNIMMTPLPGDWSIPRRLICIGTENECSDTKWMAVG